MTAIVLGLGVFLLFIVISVEDAARMRRHRAALAKIHRRRRSYYCDCSPAEVCKLCTPDEGRR